LVDQVPLLSSFSTLIGFRQLGLVTVCLYLDLRSTTRLSLHHQLHVGRAATAHAVGYKVLRRDRCIHRILLGAQEIPNRRLDLPCLLDPAINLQHNSKVDGWVCHPSLLHFWLQQFQCTVLSRVPSRTRLAPFASFWLTFTFLSLRSGSIRSVSNLFIQKASTPSSAKRREIRYCHGKCIAAIRS
jgi:hypothetical protein